MLDKYFWLNQHLFNPNRKISLKDKKSKLIQHVNGLTAESTQYQQLWNDFQDMSSFYAQNPHSVCDRPLK